MRFEEFTCELKYETTNAYLVNDGIQDIWIPKSQAKNCSESYKDGYDLLDFEIPEWLAKDKKMT